MTANITASYMQQLIIKELLDKDLAICNKQLKKYIAKGDKTLEALTRDRIAEIQGILDQL